MLDSKQTKKYNSSYKMSRIHAKNTGIEKRLAALLRKYGLRGYQRNVRGILGTPDFCWRDKKIAVFCDSSFWHGHDWKNQIRTIRTRKKFWIDKIEKNIKHDRKITRELRKDNWQVLRFWDFEINKNVNLCISRIKKLL